MPAPLKPTFIAHTAYQAGPETYQNDVWAKARALKPLLIENEEPDGDLLRLISGPAETTPSTAHVMQAVRYLQQLP